VTTVSKSDVFVSIVCAIQNAEDCLDERLRRLCEKLSSGFQYYEILLIDNASTDGTAAIVQQILQEEKNVQYCVLSSEKSESVALSAGLERAIGDFIILMDPLTDPPELIPEMLERAVSGSEIVYGLPRERVRGRGLYDRLARLFLQLIARFNRVDIPQATSTYRLFSRSVLNFILESSDHHRILALAPALSGYRFTAIEYDRLRTASDPRRVGRRALYRALELTFSTSVRPLRLISLMSVGISLLTAFYAVYVVVTRLFQENVAPGWATLSLQVSGLFFLLSIVLAVMCEYLMQVLETTSRRPVYNIAREAQSSAMDYRQELNVVEANELGDKHRGPRKLES
jgi:glycosyltransferase involved in cell wall biosynthesis